MVAPRSPLAKSPERGGLERASRVAGLLPWFAVLAITISGCYVRLTFGRWPRVYLDSPDVTLAKEAGTVAALAALSCPAMACVASLLLVVRVALRARPVLDRWVFASLLGTIVLYLLPRLDPYDFLGWALD